MSTRTTQQTPGRAWWLIVPVVLLLLAAVAVPVLARPADPDAPAAPASCGGVTTVGTEAQLNAAITAFNNVGAAQAPCVFTIQLSGDIPLTASTTTINNNRANVSLVIEGAGHTVNGQNTPGVRPFTKRLGQVTINQITITGGNVNSGGDGGGGISVTQDGSLTVTNSTITGNAAVFGGGIGNCNGPACILTVQNSTISGNTAGTAGGAIYAAGAVTIDSSTLVDNTNGTLGGAISMVAVDSTITVRNSILANSAGGAADCNINSAAGGPPTFIDGGHNLVETPGNCTFNGTGSITGQDPALGALANNGGPTWTHLPQFGSPVINASDTTLTTDQRGVARPQPVGGADDIGAVEAAATLLVNSSADTDDGSCDVLGQGTGNQDCTLREAINAANSLAGPNEIRFDIPAADAGCTAANTCTITLTNVLPNVDDPLQILGAANGGHITVDGANAHRIFLANANFDLDALTVANGNAGFAPSAGGLYVASTATVKVSNSTFKNNQAIGAGHLRNAGGTVTIVNSTFFDTAHAGVANSAGGTLTIYNSTIDGNNTSGSGGIENSLAAGNTTTLYNTIVVNNANSDCNVNGGTLTADAFNIDEDGTCGAATSKTVAEVNLQPLADNGGPTFTMALGAGSAAIDTGDNAVCAAAPVNNLDQRGVTRPQGARCDVGAVEVVQYALTVIKAGNGSGTVTSSPAGIDCGADCSESYTAGTMVTLTATPDAGNGPGSFSGAGCSGSGSCIVTMSAAQNVTVTFTLQTFALNVAKDGTGSGTVTSTPAGINCGSDCSEVLNFGSVITLTATADTGSIFTGWSGAGCSGTGDCVVTIDGAKSVTATFLACPSNPSVGTEAELNAAIGCFNAITTAGSYTINVTQNISLTRSIAIINNSTTGVDLVIVGGNHTIDGDEIHKGFEIPSPTDVTISDLTMTRCATLLKGGAIHSPGGGSLTLTNVNLTHNIAGWGGGGLASLGPVIITNSAITHNRNTATNGGGGIRMDAPGSLTLIDSEVSANSSAVSGGGIYVHSGAGLTVRNSTLSGNRGVVGSAIYSAGTLSVTNSTVSGNEETSSAQLAGAIVIASGSGALDSVTVYNNTGDPLGTSGVAYAAGASGSVRNSILAGNNNPSADLRCTASTVVALTRNLLGIVNGWAVGSSCDIDQGNNITGQAPNLGPLANNGGPTQTHLPNAGSPVINAGDTTLTVDQRGVARPQGGVDDIGAVEVACAAFPVSVANEGQLNFAIGCYNAITTAGVYTINVTQDIPLTASTTVIDNATAGVDLVINGGGFQVDGGGATPGLRPFEIGGRTTVTMNDLTVTGGNMPGIDEGGGIRNSGILTLNDATVTGNFAGYGGGIYSRGSDVQLTLNNTTVSSNRTSGDGGGINSNAALTVNDSTIQNNEADSDGGGVFIYGRPATISNTLVDGNLAGSNGGGVYNRNGTVTITGSTLSNNTAVDFGGGVRNRSGAVTIVDSTLSGNAVRDGGGGIEVNSGTLTVTGSTFANNEAETNAGTQGSGGGLQISIPSSVDRPPAIVAIKNSTFSGNAAGGNAADDGGGAMMVYTGTLTLDSVTVAGNSSAAKGGGIAQVDGTVSMRNTIVGDNTAPTGPDLAGAITSADYNLVENTAGATFAPQVNDITGVDPALGPLAFNGGTTETRALLPGSPAINEGNTTLTVDQRSVARPQGAADDIGAVEVACADVLPVPVVSIARAGTQVQLTWPAVPGGRMSNVYRSSNAPYFTPAAPPYAAGVSSPWLDPSTTSIGDVANNYFYVVRTTNRVCESGDSNRVGEFDFTLVPGTP